MDRDRDQPAWVRSMFCLPGKDELLYGGALLVLIYLLWLMPE